MPKVSSELPAPDFSIADYRGKQFTLAEFQGEKNLLLVFNRGFM